MVYDSGAVIPAHKTDTEDTIHVYSYYDIIVTHAKQFFGRSEGAWYYEPRTRAGHKRHTVKIFRFLQQKRFEEAEEYIMENTVFNPKNRV